MWQHLSPWAEGGSELMCYVKGLGKDFSGPVWTGTEGQHRVNTVKIFLLFSFSSLNNKWYGKCLAAKENSNFQSAVWTWWLSSSVREQSEFVSKGIRVIPVIDPQVHFIPLTAGAVVSQNHPCNGFESLSVRSFNLLVEWSRWMPTNLPLLMNDENSHRNVRYLFFSSFRSCPPFALSKKNIRCFSWDTHLNSWYFLVKWRKVSHSF